MSGWLGVYLMASCIFFGCEFGASHTRGERPVDCVKNALSVGLWWLPIGVVYLVARVLRIRS